MTMIKLVTTRRAVPGFENTVALFQDYQYLVMIIPKCCKLPSLATTTFKAFEKEFQSYYPEGYFVDGTRPGLSNLLSKKELAIASVKIGRRRSKPKLVPFDFPNRVHSSV
jgi:hypothetical protein